MNVEQANYLSSGDRLLVLGAGLARHQLEGNELEGTYVSQFNSPVHGRLVVVRLSGKGTYGFTLQELEIVA